MISKISNSRPVSPSVLIHALVAFLLLVSGGPALANITFLSEGFESGAIPEGWTRTMVSGNLDWQVTGTRANLSNYSAVAAFGPVGVVQDIWLISSPIFVSEEQHTDLRWYESGDFWADFGGIHQILISTATTNVGDFTPILEMTPSNHTLGAPWQAVEVNLNEYIDDFDTFYVAFRYLGEYADDWYIDDIVIEEHIPSEYDIFLDWLFSPQETSKPGATIELDMAVENLGALDSGPFDINISVTDEGGSEVLSQDEAVADIPSGETAVISANVSIPDPGYYTINATALLPGDEDPGNDTVTSDVEVMPRDLRSLAVFDFVYNETETNDARAVLDPAILDNEDLFSHLALHKPIVPSPFYNAQMDPIRQRFFDFPVAGGPNVDLNNRREWNTPTEQPVVVWGQVPGEMIDEATGLASPSIVSTDIILDPETDIARVRSIVQNFHELKPGSENRIFFYDTRDRADGSGYHATHLSTINTSQGTLLDNAPGVQVIEFDYYRDPTIPVEDLKIVTEVSRFEDGMWDRVVQSDAQRVVPRGGAPLFRASFDHWRGYPDDWYLESPPNTDPWGVFRRGGGRWGGEARVRWGTSGQTNAAISRAFDFLEEQLLRGRVNVMIDDPPVPGTEFEVLYSTGGTNFPADFTSLQVIDLANGPPLAAWEKIEFTFLPPPGTTQLRLAFVVTSPEPQGDSFLHLDDILVEPDEAANIRMTHTRDVGVRAMVFPELPILTTGPPPVVSLEVGNFVELPGDPVDFEARFLIRDQSGTVVHNQIRPVIGLAPGESRLMMFDVPTLTPGRFDFIGDVLFTGDQNGFNDRKVFDDVEAYPHPLVNFSLAVVNEGDPESDLLRAAVDGETPIWTSRYSHIQAHADDILPDRFFDEDPAMHMLLRDMPHYSAAAGLPSFSGEFLYPQEEYLGTAKAVPWTTIVQNWLAAANSHASPLTLDTSFVWFVPEISGQIWVDINLGYQLRDDRDYLLYMTITEDDADGLGYDHVPRVLYPDVNGRTIDKYPGFFQQVFSFSIDPAWKFDELRLVTWVVEKSEDGFEKIVQSHSRFVTDTPSNVGDVPARTALTGVHPNPFNPLTTVSFEMASPGRARVAVYDLAGRLVRELADEGFATGAHDLVWDGRDVGGRTVAAGVYVCRMEAAGVTETVRMTLVK